MSSPDASASAPTSDNSSATFVSFCQTLGTNVTLLVILLVLFFVLARKLAYIYVPRLVCPQPDDTRRRPPNFTITSPSDIWQMIRMEQHELIEIVGLDATMFLRLLTLGMKYFSVLTIIACGVLIPVNLNASISDGPADLISLTIQNVAEGSSVLWVHVAAVFFSTFYLKYLLKQEYYVYVDLRHRYHLSNLGADLRVDQLSVLLRDLPKHIQTDEQLQSYVSSLFEDDPVANSSLVRCHDQLRERYDQRTELVAKLEAELASQQRDASNTDEVNVMKEQLLDLNAAIKELQKEPGEPTQTGFVTFTKFQGAAMASQIPITISDTKMSAKAAPEPKDINWDGVIMTKSERSLRRIFVYASFALLLISFEVPVAFLTMLTQLKTLTKLLPFLEPLLNANPAVKAALEGFLPGLGLLIAMAIVLPVLRLLSSMRGLAAQSEIERSTFAFYYYFQLIHVIFSATIVTACGKTIQNQALMDVDLQMIFKLVADSLPSANVLYLGMILIKTFSAIPMELLRPAPLIMGWLGMRMASSASSVRACANPGVFSFDDNYPTYLLLILLGVVYLPIVPLIIPFTALLCLFASVVYRYQFMFVWSRRFEAGGAMFPLAFARIVFSLGFAQFAMVGILLNKKCNFMALLVGLLIPVTAHFYMKMKKDCGKRAKRLVLENLTRLDQDLQRNSIRLSLDQNTSFRNLRKNGESAYKQPWVVAPSIDFQVMEQMAMDADQLLKQIPDNYDALRQLVSPEFLLEARLKPFKYLDPLEV